MNKIVSVSLACMLALNAAACGSSSSSSSATSASQTAASTSGSNSEAVNISFYTTQTGQDDMYLDLTKDFESKNPGITVEYIAAGDDQLQKWMSLYASNEGPTVSYMDPINIYENQERMLDLTGNELLDNINKDALSTYTFDGKVYGVPGTAAGIGIIYNQELCDKAVGGTFDPATIKSRSDLEDLFNKIEQNTDASGTMFTGVNWSLGSHYLGLSYGAEVGDVSAREKKVADLKAGTTSLVDDPVFNGYMDTFDLMAAHNYNKEDPLVGNINMDAQALVDGKAATWFMGDWAWTYLAPIIQDGQTFGLMPVPANDDANDPVNQTLATSFAKGMCIDISQNTEEQQQAGIKFIKYLTSDDYAEEQLAKVNGQALPYLNYKGTIDSPLGQSTAKYISSGMNYDFYGTPNLLPSDFWDANGATMCQYLAGDISREDAAKAMDSYWQSQK